jgi:poly-gamma-glutamate synthesis protein (capsule biosynthesis protein)
MHKYISRLLILSLLLAGAIFGFSGFISGEYNKASVLDYLPIVSKKVVPAPERSIRLIAVGDIMLSRGVDMKMEKKGGDYPFLKMKDLLSKGDIVFANLESPIFPGTLMPTEGTTFWARPGREDVLKDVGFDVLSLANNHMGNQGIRGVNYTVYALDKVGIAHVGAGRDKDKANAPAILEKDGIKLAFLAYTDGAIIPSSYEATDYNAGVVYMDWADLEGDIKKAKESADFVIVSMHAGTEYTNRPDKKQIDFARKAIDSGAELVIGHHPHNIQDIEKYKDKYIFYSLGNFVFDQMWSEGTRQGMVADIIIKKNGVESYSLIPVRIDDYAQPNGVSEEEGEEILSNIIH